MKARLKLLGVTVILTSACSTSGTAPQARPNPAPSATTASAEQPIPASALEDHEGDSVETAVAVPADARDEGVPFENEWIFQRFGKFRRLGGGTGKLDGRRYDVIEIELWGGEKRKLYFDITENWSRWTRPGSQAP